MENLEANVAQVIGEAHQVEAVEEAIEEVIEEVMAEVVGSGRPLMLSSMLARGGIRPCPNYSQASYRMVDDNQFRTHSQE